MPVTIKQEVKHNLRMITLENGLVRAVVLSGRGADLFQFVWKPLELNCFHRTKTPLEAYEALDLAKQPLRSDGDHSLGGWMDALPQRGHYKSNEFTKLNGGIAATVPYREAVEKSADTISLCCTADLPVIPLRVEKTFTLHSNAAALDIREKISLGGDMAARFTWTQHALFGGEFIDKDTVVDVPTDRVFDAWAHLRNPERPPEDFVYPVDAIPLRGKPVSLRRPLPADYNGSEFVTFLKLREGWAALRNPAKKIALKLHYDTKVFPFLRSLYQSGKDGFIVGLEPGDDQFSGYEYSYHYGTYTTMKPGDSITADFKLEYIPW